MTTLLETSSKLVELAVAWSAIEGPFDYSLCVLYGGTGCFLEALKNDRTVDPKADKGAPGYVPPFDPQTKLETLLNGFKLLHDTEMPIDGLGVRYNGVNVAFGKVVLPQPIIDAAGA